MSYKKIKKKLKNWMKQYMNNYAEKCKNGRLSSRSLGIMVRSFHMATPSFFMYNLLFGPYWLCIFSIIFLFVVSTLFFVFDSCFLTILEQNLCNDNFVIMDPTLEFFNLEINTANRYYISNVIGINYLIIIYLIFYIRFYT